MSLTKISMMDVVKKQYFYKLKAYSQVFMTLIILQVIAIAFSFYGIGSLGTSSETVKIEIRYYSADLVAAFTMLWGFITAIMITTKAYRNDDFVFVANRLSSNLSNMLFLLTASTIGGMTTMLSSYLMKVISYYFVGDFSLKSIHVMAAPLEFVTGFFAATLYVMLFCALGYLVGTLVQFSKVFAVLLPALLIGALFLGEASGYAMVVQRAYQFFFTESSILVFVVKVIAFAGLFFASAFALSNRMEVRQ